MVNQHVQSIRNHHAVVCVCISLAMGFASPYVNGQYEPDERQTEVDPFGTPRQFAELLHTAADQARRGIASTDVGDIAVLHDDGTLVTGPAGGLTTNTTNIVNAFFQTHNDEYDQLIIHVASTYFFDVDPEAGFAFFQISAGFVGGINRTQGNPNAGIGRTRLGGICNMNDLPEYPDDPTANFFGNGVASYVEILGQEFGHQFLSFVQPPAATGADILGRSNAHWSFFLHHPGVGNASPMEGNRWGPVLGGFQTIEAFTGYCELDEYLMGLRTPETVTPFFVLDFENDPFPDSRFPALDVMVSTFPINLTVQDIIDNHGPRGPSTTTSPKRFKVAFILVNGPGVPIVDADIEKLDAFRHAWEAYFDVATNSLGVMDTTLGLPPSVAPSVFASADDFESGVFDAQRYEWIQGATIDEMALNTPSGTRALHMDGNWGGGDEVRSMPIDLASRSTSQIILRYAAQRTGSGDSPEPGDNLLIEYFSTAGEWIRLRRILGEGFDETTFTPYADVLPVDGVFEATRFRFRRRVDTVGAEDDFFIDDVQLLVTDMCPADLTDAGGPDLPDGSVDIADLNELLDNWTTDGRGASLAAPPDVVDVFDLLELLRQWGDCE